MRVGVVGGGYWGSKHLRVFAGMSSVSEVTLIERVPELRAQLAASFPGVRVAADLDDVLDQLDGVVIATKPSSHFELGRKVLEAGKHALIEKPMTTSLADAIRLQGLAQDNGLILMAGHTFEFNPVVVELRRRIEAGELGDIHYMRAMRLNLGLYQGDINVVWDLAPHDFSIMNYLLDDSPTSVTAWGHQAAQTGFEDVAMVRLEYERKRVEAYVHVSWLDPSKVREVTVVGSRRMAVYDDVKSEERLRLFDRGLEVPTTPATPTTYQAPMSYRYGDITSPFIDFREPLLLEDSHFVEAVSSGRATMSDSVSGCRVVAALEAAQISMEAGRPVRLDELADLPDLALGLDRAAEVGLPPESIMGVSR